MITTDDKGTLRNRLEESLHRRVSSHCTLEDKQKTLIAQRWQRSVSHRLPSGKSPGRAGSTGQGATKAMTGVNGQETWRPYEVLLGTYHNFDTFTIAFLCLYLNC